MTTNVAMNGEIAEVVSVRGDGGGCAGFLPKEFWIAEDVFVDFFDTEEGSTVLLYDVFYPYLRLQSRYLISCWV